MRSRRLSRRFVTKLPSSDCRRHPCELPGRISASHERNSGQSEGALATIGYTEYVVHGAEVSTQMKLSRIIGVSVIAAMLLTLAPQGPVSADGAASTRNIILGGAAAALIIINHNKQ